MGYGGWGVMGWMMSLFWVLLMVIAVMAVVWLVRASATGGRYPPRNERDASGLDVLGERFARGEINRDEYLQRKRDLLAHGGSD
ncbi:MAG: SHOCT domain-containing protein [Alphaproteobacteria bacterium]|nr:SHOCT domain-containing protein [Alphaproteobacteria bacterium]